MTVPPLIPPAAAVYVNAIVLPVCDAETLDVLAASVPDPSADSTVMTGGVAIDVRTPAEVDASCTFQVCAPGVDGAVAVLPEPYVMISVCAAVRVTPVTVIVWPETVSGRRSRSRSPARPLSTAESSPTARRPSPSR